ncbi:hypothetical protein GCM10025777_05300 [Membranihabitans marinus]
MSQGDGYRSSVYYSLSTGESTSVDYQQWDIAFQVSSRGLAVAINEAASSATDALPPVALYSSSVNDFDAVLDTSHILDQLYNGGSSWSEGAFNSLTDTADVFDFGWGSYNPASHDVIGSRVFIVKLRNGEYRKCMIDLLRGSKYYFRYGDLESQNIVVDSIDKSDFENKQFAYYSLQNQQVLDLEPEDWDLKFTRYNTPLDDGQGGILDYNVTGVLLRGELEAIKVTGVDPATVPYSDYEDQWSSNIETIGHEWKSFSLSTFQYEVADDQVYFIKTANDSIYRLQFIDFEGSSTGISTFQKTYETVLASYLERPSYINEFKLYPNPILQGRDLNGIISSTKTVKEAEVSLYNVLGQRLFHQSLSLQVGDNPYVLPSNFQPGLYHLVLSMDGSAFSKKLIIQ